MGIMNSLFSYLSQTKISSKEAQFIVGLLLLIFLGILIFYMSTFYLVEAVAEPRSVVPLQFEEDNALRTT